MVKRKMSVSGLAWQPIKKLKNKPAPNWFPNLIFLVITVVLVHHIVTWANPLITYTLSEDFSVSSPTIPVLLVLMPSFAMLVYYRTKVADVKTPAPSETFRYHAAEKQCPNPLLALTPLPEDRPRFKEVIDAEWYEIANGRMDKGHSLTDPIRGMCFSGGGIRAASFMAGAFEVFEDTDMLPKMDYLSTVSGGGYTGSAFMTRDREAKRTVERLVRRMTDHSDYLGVTSKEGNPVAAVDFALSVIATFTNNGIGVLAYSVVFTEYLNFVLVWMYGKATRRTVASFLLASEDEAVNIETLQSTCLKYTLIFLLMASVMWVVVYGLYSANTSRRGVQRTLTGGTKRSINRRRSVMMRSATPTCFGRTGSSSWLDHSPAPAPLTPRLEKSKAAFTDSPMSYPATPGSEEDAASDDEPTEGQAPPPLGIEYNRQVFTYLLRCFIVACVTVLLSFALLYITRFLLRLQQADKLSGERGTNFFLSVEMSVALTFAIGRGLTLVVPIASDAVKTVITLTVGLGGLIAVLFIVARVVLWRVLGCAFYVCKEEYPAMQCDLEEHLGIDGCCCPILPYWLFVILLYTLVVEVFIREPLGQALHDMYRRRLVGSFYKNGKDKPFSVIPRRPYFICNVALNSIQDVRLGNRTTHSFFMSKRFCGSPLVGYRSTDYLGVYLSKGMAISGAALSTQFDTLLTAPVKMAMMLMGIDLGEWFRFRQNDPKRHYLIQLVGSLPFITLIYATQVKTDNPYELNSAQIQLYGISMLFFVAPLFLMIGWGLILQLFRLEKSNFFLHLPLYRRFYQFFGFLSWRKDPYFYLADGGWFDFYGLYELIRRGAREIFIFDADADQTNFFELLDALMRAESDLRVDFDLDTCDAALADIMRRKKGDPGKRNIDLVGQNVFHFKLFYPKKDPDDPDEEQKCCDVWLGKLSLTGKEPPWVKLFAISDKSFPHHITYNQAFDSVTFKAYRELGRHVAQQVHEAWSAYHAKELEVASSSDGTEATSVNTTPPS